MTMSSKSKLMPANTKASFLIKQFTDQSKMNHAMISKDMKRFAEYFYVLQPWENDDALADSLLDYKPFCSNHSIFDEFFIL